LPIDVQLEVRRVLVPKFPEIDQQLMFNHSGKQLSTEAFRDKENQLQDVNIYPRTNSQPQKRQDFNSQRLNRFGLKDSF
jgi:hypothetical protein